LTIVAFAHQKEYNESYLPIKKIKINKNKISKLKIFIGDTGKACNTPI
jgi:hypothetical protein